MSIALPSSVLQMDKHPSRSTKYIHVPTVDVINHFVDQGWEVRKAEQSKCRTPENVAYTRHWVNLIAPQEKSFGEFTPQITITNSHNGTSSFKFIAGLFRFVCSNGLVVGTETHSIIARHSQNELGRVINGEYEVVMDEVGELAKTATAWKGIALTTGQSEKFAYEAALLRHEKAAVDTIHLPSLLSVTREDDKGAGLWQTYNRVQEKLIKGGYYYLNGESDHMMRARVVKDGARDHELNRALFKLAGQYSEAA